MNTQPSSWTRLLYYGEAVGVVVAWAIGVLVLFGADPAESPGPDADQVATANSAEVVQGVN